MKGAIKMRTRAERRRQRYLHITRKEAILKGYRNDNPPSFFDSNDLFGVQYQLGFGNCTPYWYTKHRGTLSKGKIHCSCPMCAFHGSPMQDKRAALKAAENLKDAGETASKAFRKANGIIHDRQW